MEQDSQFQVGCSEVIEYLHLVRWIERPRGLELEHDPRFDEDVAREESHHLAIEGDFSRRVHDDVQPPPRQLPGERPPVDALEKSVSEPVVHVVEGPDDPVRELPLEQVVVTLPDPPHAASEG